MIRYKTIEGFTTINRNTSPFLLATGEFADSQNFYTERIGVLKKTGDYSLKNAQITASQDILGGIDFFRAAGTHEHFVAIDGASNAGIYKDVTGTWTTQSQSLTAGNKVRFAYSPTLDTLFAVNFADATRSYNGSSWSTTTDVTSAPKGKDIISFGRRIYILHAVVSSTTYVDRGYRSSLVDSGSITWDTTNDWVTFDDILLGAEKNGDLMIVFGQNGIYGFTLSDQKYKISNIGCVSLEGISTYKEWTFYPSDDGIYVTTGKEPDKISLPIQEYFDGIPQANKPSILGKCLGPYYYVWFGDITSPETLTNVWFRYDILKNNWHRMKTGFNMMNLHTFTSSSVKALYAGDDDGKVYQMLTSGAQATASYATSLETDWIYGDDPKVINDWISVWGFGDQLSGLKVFYRVDDSSDWKPAGELEGSTDFVQFKAQGYRIKILLTESSKSNMFEFYRIEVGYIPKGEKQEDTQK